MAKKIESCYLQGVGPRIGRGEQETIFHYYLLVLFDLRLKVLTKRHKYNPPFPTL